MGHSKRKRCYSRSPSRDQKRKSRRKEKHKSKKPERGRESSDMRSSSGEYTPSSASSSSDDQRERPRRRKERQKTGKNESLQKKREKKYEPGRERYDSFDSDQEDGEKNRMQERRKDKKRDNQSVMDRETLESLSEKLNRKTDQDYVSTNEDNYRREKRKDMNSKTEKHEGNEIDEYFSKPISSQCKGEESYGDRKKVEKHASLYRAEMSDRHTKQLKIFQLGDEEHKITKQIAETRERERKLYTQSQFGGEEERETVDMSDKKEEQDELPEYRQQHKSTEVKERNVKPRKKSHIRGEESDEDSEEELAFDWDNHRHDLDRMFFADDDAVRRGTEEHRDFWAFLKKYHSLQKQRKIREMCGRNAGPTKGRENAGASLEIYKDCEQSREWENNRGGSVYDLPHPYNKRYNVNFALSITDVEARRSRLPPRDLEDGRKRLSKKKLLEFKLVLLLYLDFVQRQKFEKLKKLRATQADLPIAVYKDEIISRVREHSVVIVAGDTGCGKSTQVPQYLMEAGFSNMACTQPRRIACIALSKRVAYETLNEFGSKVGYQIRFEKTRTEFTKIVFVTEGLLLRQVSGERGLEQYDVIILDEVHERHLDTDLLLGVAKVLVTARPSLRVVLMSATINLDLFAKYFQGRAPVVQVPGRLHPITLQYLPIPNLELTGKKDRIDPAPYVRVLQLVDHKYPQNERGDLLIFLSGVSEISTVVEAARAYGEQSGRWVVLPLHSTLAITEQEKVFHVPPEGVRKCIISTNIAETSVTIDGVRFVVDSGKVKEMSYDAQSKIRRLKEFWISQASAEQRKGRAGRTGPGTCFRLYSEKEYAEFTAYSSPEVQRVPLDSLVLRLASMGLPNTRLFPFIEPPPPESLEHALIALKAQDALTPGEALTTLGRLLAHLPVDVSLGKMLIMGSLFHQVEPVLSLAAVMSVQSPVTPRARRDPDCLNMVKELESDHGDPLTLLAAYREWLGVKQEGGQDSRRWCRRRGLEEQRFYETTKLRHQFSRLLHDSGLQDIGGTLRAKLTSAERAKRSGQLRQLHELKNRLRKEDGPQRPKRLKMSYADGDEEEGTDIKDVDFRIKHDHRQLEEIRRGAWVRSAKDMVILKLVLCSGLYPNLAIADEHNNYKPGSEQLFHAPTKPFAALHPTGVFSAHPEVLQVPDSEIFELPGFTLRYPASPRHQLLAYVSLLETNKIYLVDTLRVPAAQILLLFAQALDSNADLTRVVCDAYIELRFPDASAAQNIVFRAAQLRTKWQRLLDLRIEASESLNSQGKFGEQEGDKKDSEPDKKDWAMEQDRQDKQDRLNREADLLERDLTAGLVEFYHSDVLYSQRRLLAADVSLLHKGPGPYDSCVMAPNPFSSSRLEPCRPNDTKGGVDLTDFLTYDCLLETDCSVFPTSSYDTVCPYCGKEFHLTTLERLGHLAECLDIAENAHEARPQVSEEEEKYEDDPRKRAYECDVCMKTLRLTIKEIFHHKRSHHQ